jgi:O-antigen ligase
MSIAFLYLLMLREPTEREVYQVLIAIGAIGLLYVTMNAVANSGLAPGLAASRTYRNADVMYIPLGFVALWTARRALASMAVVALGAFVFVTYPSATSALVALATAVTLFVTKPKGGRARLHLVAIVVLAGLVASIFFFGRAVEFGNEYFQVVGKKDNSNTRLALWQAGLEHFASSPIVGDVFSGETTVLVFRQSGGGAPFHNPYNNDYILFLASGGVLMFALLVWWIVWVERTAVRRYRGFLAGGQLSRAALMRALLVAFNAWFVAAAFNPLFSGMGRTVTLFSIYAMMMALGTPAVAAATAASSVREPALASARG